MGSPIFGNSHSSLHLQSQPDSRFAASGVGLCTSLSKLCAGSLSSHTKPKPYTLCGYAVPKFGDPCRGDPGFDVAAACTYGLGYLRLERVLEAFELLGFSAALRSLSASILEASASQIRCLLETGLNNPNGGLGVYHALVRRGRCNTEPLTLRPCLRSLARWDKGL